MDAAVYVVTKQSSLFLFYSDEEIRQQSFQIITIVISLPRKSLAILLEAHRERN